jgi:hypothetical protein
METYKPLLFTTTVRNPERLKDFLTVLSQYDGEILTNAIMDKVAKEFIRRGLYRPMIVSDDVKKKWKLEIELEDAETETVFEENPQSHKEAGFDRGWASRFATWFDLAKELGFVYFWVGERIEFSESGLMLLNKEKPENEQMVFANAFAKYQRQNPFRRIRNRNVPLILLISVIQLLNDDPDFNGAGISRKEIPLLLCWRDEDAEALYRTIKELREKYDFAPSDEVILEMCEELIENNGRVTRMNNNSILVDYPDDFIRKMRLTGLISIRGGGRFVDINTKELVAVNHIVNNYSTYVEFQDERAFFRYIGTVDKDLISTLTVYAAPVLATTNELQRWVQHYDWNSIKAEMMNLARNSSSRDPILKVIERPLRLEFLTSLAIVSKLPNVTVKPNFTSDDEGLPVSFASGGNPDIECLERKDTVLVEVTLLTGTQQHIRESQSVRRHLESYTVRGVDAYAIFISPKAFIDTCENAVFNQHRFGLEIRILDIDLFVEQLETNSTLRDVAYTASSCS